MSTNRKINFIVVILLLLAGGCSAHIEVKTAFDHPNQPIVLTTFQGAQKSSWVVDAHQQLVTNQRLVRFSGTCPVGLYSVQFTNSVTSQTLGAPVFCENDHGFHWSYLTPADGTYSFSYDGHQASSSVISKSALTTVVVITTPPAAPVITTNKGAKFTTSTATTVLNGTVSTRATQILSSQCVQITFVPNSGVFECLAHLKAGQITHFSFSAIDLVGNTSAATQIAIARVPNLSLNLKSNNPTPPLQLSNGFATVAQ